MHGPRAPPQVMADEQVDTQRGNIGVLNSSVNLFMYIKDSIKRCVGISNGQTFFLLHKEFKQCLQNYSEKLVAKASSATPDPHAAFAHAPYGPHRS